MAPKKKGGKKKDDDWDAGLGETIDPIAQAETEAKQAEATKDAEEGEDVSGGGGLLAALKKNRGKKAKKGKVVEDFVEGEDPVDAYGVDGEDITAGINLQSKAPEEANLEDEDAFGGPAKKGKGGKGGGKPAQQQRGKKDEDEDEAEDDEDEAGGKMKTKKEKEKEKKEREKQRKKDQVRAHEMLPQTLYPN